LTNGLPQDKYIFPLLAYSGIRIGELIALKWPDIDFDDNTINITKTIYNPKNNDKDYILLTPKTKGSIRKIKIDDDIINSLRQHKKEQNLLKMYHRDEYVDNNFIFTKPSGHPMLQKTINWRMTRLSNQTNLINT
jgi:integrase